VSIVNYQIPKHKHHNYLSQFINLLIGDKNIHVCHNIASQMFDVNTSRHMVADRLVKFVDTSSSSKGVTDSDILEKITNFLQDTGRRAAFTSMLVT